MIKKITKTAMLLSFMAIIGLISVSYTQLSENENNGISQISTENNVLAVADISGDYFATDKCGAGKCGEGKCGEGKTKETKAKKNESKKVEKKSEKKAEKSTKKAEKKTTKKTTKSAKESKCGAGKCGGN